MPNYEVGDKLRITKSDEVFTKGEVVTIVEVDPIDRTLTYRCLNGERKHWVNNEDFEPVSKFSVGQIYRAETPIVDRWKGSIIRITKANVNNVTLKPIRGEAPSDFMPGSQYGGGLALLTGAQIGEAIKKWDADHAKKAEPAVKEVNREAEIGEYIKIVEKIDEADPYKVGDVFKVKSTTCFKGDVRVDTEFSNDVYVDKLEYVVLEGYSPAPQVKEVKRRAEIGEYIKMLNPDYNTKKNRYSAGDILRVTTEGPILPLAKLKSGEKVTVFGDDYVVLEGYTPGEAESPAEPKEEKRKAKVGETVKAILNNGGFIYGGKTYKVSSVHEDGGVGVHDPDGRYPGMTNIISNGNYVVISSDVHRYTDSQIEEAKRIVLDTIREYAEKDEQISVHRVDNSTAKYEAVIIHHDTELTAVESWRWSWDKPQKKYVFTSEYAVSKCGPNDEPNEWIGKCVAICKLLGKPIPRFIMDNGTVKRFSLEKAQRLCHDGNVITIHCKNEKEGNSLKAELEKLGVLWRGGNKPTEKNYFGDGCFVIENGKTLSFNKRDGHDKFVEFSDCFTEN